MMTEPNLTLLISLANLVAMVVGGAIAVGLTLRYLGEIRDAVKDLSARMGGVEQRVSTLEGRIYPQNRSQS